MHKAVTLHDRFPTRGLFSLLRWYGLVVSNRRRKLTGVELAAVFGSRVKSKRGTNRCLIVVNEFGVVIPVISIH